MKNTWCHTIDFSVDTQKVRLALSKTVSIYLGMGQIRHMATNTSHIELTSIDVDEKTLLSYGITDSWTYIFGYEIYVYCPFKKELQDLWVDGVNMYDVQIEPLACVWWTMTDFLAYVMLSS